MKKVVLTFDDGLVQHLKYVAPLLQQYGFGGSFYINGAFVELAREQPQFMNLHQVRELHDLGFEIGNHCFNHADMTVYGPERFLKDATRMHNLLKTIDIQATTLAYPGFHVDAQVAAQIPKLGYRLARAGCEKTLKFEYFQKGNSGSVFNYLTDNPYNANCLGVFGTGYLENWFSDLCRLGDDDNQYGIFCFHDFDTQSPVSTPKAVFEKFLEYLHRKEFQVIALGDIQ